METFVFRVDDVYFGSLGYLQVTLDLEVASDLVLSICVQYEHDREGVEDPGTFL